MVFKGKKEIAEPLPFRTSYPSIFLFFANRKARPHPPYPTPPHISPQSNENNQLKLEKYQSNLPKEGTYDSTRSEIVASRSRCAPRPIHAHSLGWMRPSRPLRRL